MSSDEEGGKSSCWFKERAVEFEFDFCLLFGKSKFSKSLDIKRIEINGYKNLIY